MTNQNEYLSLEQPARLIPVIADSSKEQRATSVFLAVFAKIPALAEQLLLPMNLGWNLGKNSKIETYTEVILKNTSDKKDRPDGLLIIVKGKRVWRALIEVKTRNSKLETEQIDRYLRIAKDYKFDAVITVSNQFVARPEQSPVNVQKNLLKSVKLFHWSWKFIQTEAKLLEIRQDLENSCEAYILNEFLRFLNDDSDCIAGIQQMPPSWQKLVNKVTKGEQIHKGSLETEEIVATWYSEVRELELQLSQKVEANVSVKMLKDHASDPLKRLEHGRKQLADSNELKAEFEIPDLDPSLDVVVDIKAKAIRTSMTIVAPKDIPTSKGKIGWLLKQLQLEQTQQENISIGMIFDARKHHPLHYDLKELNENQALRKLPELPKKFVIYSVYQDGKNFPRPRVFIEALEQAVPEFYDNVGQNFRK